MLNDFWVWMWLSAQTNYRDLKDIPVKLKSSNLKEYSDEKVPLLKDLLRTIPENRLLVIEIKCGQEIIPHLQKSINKYWKTGKYCIYRL